MRLKSDPVLLQILPSLHSGGVERGTLDIARAAHLSGYISLVASSGGKLVASLEKSGAKWINLPLQTKNPFKMISNSQKLYHLCRNRSVNIIHARSRAPAWSAYGAHLRLPASRFITTFHGFYGVETALKTLL